MKSIIPLIAAILALTAWNSAAAEGERNTSVSQVNESNDEDYVPKNFSLSFRFGCLVRQDHTVGCWNLVGDSSMKTIENFPNVVQVSGGSRLFCALSNKGRVWCSPRGPALREISDNDFPNLTEISVGDEHICGITEQRQIKCVGGWRGESSVDIGPGSYEAIQVSAGRYHSCAIYLREGRKYASCWGDNIRHPQNIAGLFAEGEEVYQIAAGNRFSCIIAGSNRTVRCTRGIENTPSARDLSNVKQLALGGSHACALTFNGRVQCWGGRIGPRPENSEVNVPDDLELPVLGISASSRHTCANVGSGRVRCWGERNGKFVGSVRDHLEFVPLSLDPEELMISD